MKDCFFEIFIPSFRQQDKLNTCLQSIGDQSFRSFQVTIIDDASGENYDSILNAGWPFKIKVLTNQFNYGAVNNMLHCMEIESRSPYVLVFHEDDIMHPQYLQTAHTYLSKDKNISLFVSTMSFYNGQSTPVFDDLNLVNLKIIDEEKDLIRQFLLGKSISLSSCIYQKNELDPKRFDLERFSMLGDRPFMCQFLGDKKCIAFADGNFIIADDHSEADSRWKSLRVKHLQNLFSYYKSFFTKSDKGDRHFLNIHLTRLTMEAYALLENQFKPGRLSYVVSNILKGNLSPKYYLLLYPVVRRSIEKVKGKLQ